MDLRALRYFTTVANELNITRAAEKLNMSQPPLTHQIHLLEDELGAPLFIRGKRRLQLTEEGELLLRRANQLLDLADKTRQELREMKDGMSGTLYLALVEGRAPYLSARWIAGFKKEHPMVRYNLWNGSSDDVLERLHNGLADLALIATPYDAVHLNGILADSEPWVAMIPAGHPLAALPGDTIPLRLLAGQPLIVPSRKSRIQAIWRWFQEIGQEPDILCEMSHYVDALALTEQGVGISIFPQTTPDPGTKIVSKVITDPPRQAEYVLVWNKQQSPSRLAQAFIEYVSNSIEPESSEN